MLTFKYGEEAPVEAETYDAEVSGGVLTVTALSEWGGDNVAQWQGAIEPTGEGEWSSLQVVNEDGTVIDSYRLWVAPV